MARYLVTQTWEVDVPDDEDDPFDYARDIALNQRPDTEDIERITDDVQ